MPTVSYDARVIVYYKPDTEESQTPHELSEQEAVGGIVDAVSKAIFGGPATIAIGIVPTVPMMSWPDVLVCVDARSPLRYGDTPQSDCQRVAEDLLSRLFKLEPVTGPSFSMEVELSHYGKVLATAGGIHNPPSPETQDNPKG